MKHGDSARGDGRAAGRPPETVDSGAAQRRRPAPPEKTHAEEYYFIKQMNARTPMVIVLQGGETLHGWVEWYDEDCLKVNRADAPNLLVYKHCIRYLHKDPEAASDE